MAVVPMKPPRRIVTTRLPSRCPACASLDIACEDRGGGWWRVSCRNAPGCTWFEHYELSEARL